MQIAILGGTGGIGGHVIRLHGPACYRCPSSSRNLRRCGISRRKAIESTWAIRKLRPR
jgi:hypothetical protein